MAWTGALECQTVSIRDSDGTRLTTACIRELDEELAIGLADVEDAWALLDYVFGRGERQVVVEHRSLGVEGILDTRWIDGERIWWVQLTEALVHVHPSHQDHELIRHNQPARSLAGAAGPASRRR